MSGEESGSVNGHRPLHRRLSPDTHRSHAVTRGRDGGPWQPHWRRRARRLARRRPFFLFAGHLEPIEGLVPPARAFSQAGGAALFIAGDGSQRADLDALVVALQALVDDPVEAQRLGEEATEMASRYFSAGAVFRRCFELVFDVAKGCGIDPAAASAGTAAAAEVPS